MCNRNFILLYICIVALFAACSSDAIPADVLPQAVMVPVLTDLEIAYAGVDQTVKNPKERNKKYQDMNGLVLKKHNLEHEQFYASYQWYEANPLLLDTIFKQVVTLLNEELAALQKAESAPARPKVPELK